YFLDHVVDTIWEMSRTDLEDYKGNYSAYLRQRQERWERQQAVFTATKERLAEELEFIKHGYARMSTHSIAEGKLKRLSRDLAVIELRGLAALDKPWAQQGTDVHKAADRPLSISEAAKRIRILTPPR